MEQKKTIMLVDDHRLFRDGLKTILDRDSKYHVAGEASTAREAKKTAIKLKPDMFIVDISLPDKSGIELIREIRCLLPETSVMVVSMHSRIDYIAEAFQAGATGYVIKETAFKRLLYGINLVFKGEYYLDSAVSPVVIKKLLRHPVKKMRITDGSCESLTAREQEVMSLLANGLSIKEVGRKLFISHKTVENHRTSIMSKINIKSRWELIRFAAKLGLVDVDAWKS